MKICCIGREFGADEVESMSLGSPRTLLDYDLVIIDFQSFDAGHIQASPPALEALQRRRKEIVEFLALGRTVVAFVSGFPLFALLPVANVGTTPSVGNRVDFEGPDSLKQFWTTVEKWMTYLAYMDGVIGRPFLYVSETKKPVASLVKHGRGNLLLLPWLEWDENAQFPPYRQKCTQFLRALTALIGRLTPQKAEISLPGWSAHIGWQREGKLREELLSLQQQADELSRLMTARSNELATEERLKILFTGKGDILVD